jgi:LPXTG-motif cell wall-anchored protein
VRRDRLWLAILILAALTAAAWAFRDRLWALPGGDLQYILYLGMAALLVGGGLVAYRRRNAGLAWLRDALIWAAIFATVTLAVANFAPSFTQR